MLEIPLAARLTLFKSLRIAFKSGLRAAFFIIKKYGNVLNGLTLAPQIRIIFNFKAKGSLHQKGSQDRRWLENLP